MSDTPAFRIGGLGSGFDVSGTISKIMEMERKRLTTVEEAKTLNTDKKTAWVDIKENLAGLTSATDTLRWMDIWRKMAPTSTNPSVATATAADTAERTTYSVEVLQMAKSQAIASSTGLTVDGTPTGTPVTTSTLLTDIAGINDGDQFAIGGQTLSISASDTLLTLRDKINTASINMPEAEQVTASILDNRIVLQRVKTGEDAINISDITGNPLVVLGIQDGGGNAANELIAAQDAIFSVNGALVTRSSNTGLSDIVDGVTFNFYSEGTSEIKIGQDTEAIKGAIQTFIDAYNTAAEVNEFYGSYDRTDPSNPVPGLLQDDSMIRDMSYKIRSLATQLMNTTHTPDNAAYEFNGIEGVMNTLQAVGIWTDGETNRLAIVDEDRLDAMLELYPNEVENLFRGIPSETDPGLREGGIALSIYQTSQAYSSDLDGWIDFRLESINEEIVRQDDRMERITRELEMKEAMLWRQFGAMDEAIGTMKSGFDYLIGQIGGSK